MSQAVVTISSAPRGLPGQAAATFVPAQVVATWSWGLQPATALIDWVSAQSQAAVISLASMLIEVGGLREAMDREFASLDPHWLYTEDGSDCVCVIHASRLKAAKL